MSAVYHSSPTDFYSELLNDLPNADVRRSYRLMQSVLRRSVEQLTDKEHLQHPTLFAKLNYLLNENDAPSPLRRSINTARGHLRRASVSSPELLREWRLHDLRALCELIERCYGEPIPTQLKEQLPLDIPEYSAREQQLYDCVRLVVTDWTDTLIRGRAEALDAESIEVDYSTSNPYFYGRDWSYLSRTLRAGTQLNLVRLHLQEEGPGMPELIIVEPDILLDVTAVVGCIETYADSPLVYLINRLKPSTVTPPILMGNLAGQLLDETINEVQRPYAESAKTFFRSSALQLATTEIPTNFHAEAQQQAAHIRTAVEESLQKYFKSFRRDDVVLEPTFFCETLGLQGRMDMLQADCRILLEQKAGKGKWPGGKDPELPIAQDKHYAQMLLYMAILHYGLGLPNERISAFLLYSKYAKGLLNLGPAPELLHKALMLRNQMARMEQYYAEEGFGVLLQLTPERLRQKPGGDVLWEGYTRPELEALLSPISLVSDLERAYYLRMLRFVSMEHMLSKVGNIQKENSGFAAKWHDSIDEKRLSGNIYSALTLTDMLRADGSRMDSDSKAVIEELTFSKPAENPRGETEGESVGDSSNFRRGDIVVLYPYPEGTEPDVRRTPVLRGSISDILGDTISVRLRAPQSRLLPGEVWAIEHDLFESSATTLFRGIHAFLSAPQSQRDLWLGQRRPQVDDTLKLRGEYGDFNELALRVRQSRDLFLIIGPPGTGKTSFGLMTTLKEELHDPEATVLLLSYTNRAVDEACSKLIAEGLDFVRIGGSLSCSEECRPYLLEERMQSVDTAAQVADLISHARIITGTTASLCTHLELFRLKSFTLTILDEASQILEPQLLPLLSQPIGRIVMIGDHKQLPAVVQQSEDEARIEEPLLRSIGLMDCRQSLFERMLRTYADDPSVVYMLTRQGRMHPEVADFPNEAFYEGQLCPVPLPHQQAESPQARVEFIDAPLPEHSPSDKVNPVEADIIAATVCEIRAQQADASPSVGIIVPYRNQIAAIRSRLQREGINDVMIDTVERFQGSQRQIIIYGFTVQKRYQLGFLTSHTFEEKGHLIDRKLNVAMTRAMERLILVGHAPLLRQSPVFAALLDKLHSR